MSIKLVNHNVFMLLVYHNYKPYRIWACPNQKLEKPLRLIQSKSNNIHYRCLCALLTMSNCLTGFK